MNDRKLLEQVEGIGPHRSAILLHEFEDGREVAKVATNAWGKIAEIDGFSEELAREMFDRLGDAGVYHKLRGY